MGNDGTLNASQSARNVTATRTRNAVDSGWTTSCKADRQTKTAQPPMTAGTTGAVLLVVVSV